MPSLFLSALTDYSLINVIGNAVIVFDCLIDFRFAEILLFQIKTIVKMENVKMELD